jgi:hypothetical protein
MNTLSIWSGLRRLLALQLAVGAVVTCIAAWWWNPVIAAGVAYGVAFAMLNAYWLAQRMVRASQLDRAGSQRVVYASAVQRFLFLLLALFAAYKLGLHLLAVAAGLLVAQMAMFVFALLNAGVEIGSGSDSDPRGV